MTHTFDVDMAVKYGVSAAVVYSNILYWVSKNKANGENQHDGRTWTYNSVRAFGELFPYFTQKKIGNALKLLEEKGVILSGRYNSKGYDRTKWYALVDESIIPKRQMDNDERENPLCQKGEPIPDINTDSKPGINQKKKTVFIFDQLNGFLPDNLKTETFRVMWDEWVDYKGKTLTERAVKMQLSFLAKYSVVDAVEIMAVSIRNGWKGLFAPKNATPNRSSRPAVDWEAAAKEGEKNRGK